MSFDTQEVIATLRKAPDEGAKVGWVLDTMGRTRKEQGAMRRFLESLVKREKIEKIGRGLYAASKVKENPRKLSPKQSNETKKQRRTYQGSDPQCTGRIRVHPAGYGFVVRDDEADDVFVPAKYRGSALDGDEVLVYTWQGYKGTEGRVDEVLSRGRAKLTGVLERGGNRPYVVPDDPRIHTDFGQVQIEGGSGGAKEGQCVVVEITEYPTSVLPRMIGRISAVLGDPEDPRTEIQKIIVCADIPYDMPQEVLKLAESISDEVGPEDMFDRVDLRDRDFLTIDPETARDFDDAICIEEGPLGGPRVSVAVADVSHYVRQGNALDLEAQIRGVSVYLPDQVIPMLPMKLSAGICSLNPHVDRCAMVVRMDYDKDYQQRDISFSAAVIRSSDRLDYPGVAAALDGDFRGRRERYRKWIGNLERMHTLAQALRKKRRARGTLELEIAEAKIVLDADDPTLVRDVVRSKGTEGVKQAYQLVEEFMIAANEAVGAFFRSRDLPSVWRVHAPPKEERLEELAEMLEAFGIYVDVEEAQSPLGMAKVLGQVNDLPSSQALSFLVLRSLTQAVYDTTNVGHFGLASREYIHFTSPIRRYPDLLVHRLMKHQLHKEALPSGGAAGWKKLSEGELKELASSCSSHERRAVEAEREAVAMYRAYLMRSHVGEIFKGRITGVTHFGAFVEIDEPFVEGLIKVDSLGDDHFDYDAVTMQLSGRRSGFTLSLGDEVEVQIVSVSVAQRRIELALSEDYVKVEMPSSKGPQRGRGHSTGRSRSGSGSGRGKGHGSQGKKPSPGRGSPKPKPTSGGRKRKPKNSGGGGVNHRSPTSPKGRKPKKSRRR